MALGMGGKILTGMALLFSSNMALAQSTNTKAAVKDIPVVTQEFKIAPEVAKSKIARDKFQQNNVTRGTQDQPSTQRRNPNPFGNRQNSFNDDNQYGMIIEYSERTGAIHLTVNGVIADADGETDLKIDLVTKRGGMPDTGPSNELEFTKFKFNTDNSGLADVSFNIKQQYDAQFQKAAFLVIPRSGDPYYLNAVFSGPAFVKIIDADTNQPFPNQNLAAAKLKEATVNGIKAIINPNKLKLKDVYGANQAIEQPIELSPNIRSRPGF